MKKPFPVPVRVNYSCAKCPAYCCTYTEIEVTPRDIERLARLGCETVRRLAVHDEEAARAPAGPADRGSAGVDKG